VLPRIETVIGKQATPPTHTKKNPLPTKHTMPLAAR